MISKDLSISKTIFELLINFQKIFKKFINAVFKTFSKHLHLAIQAAQLQCSPIHCS